MQPTRPLAAMLALACLLEVPVLAQPVAWTKDALLTYAQDHASSLINAKIALQNAKDKVNTSSPFWQSSVGASAQLVAGENGTLSPTTSFSSSWKPLDQLSVEVSVDLQSLKTSASLHPFANSTAVTSAQQALELEQLKFENSRSGLVKTILTSYYQWVRAQLNLDIASQDRTSKSDSLEAEQIRYDAGKSSDSAIGDARIALLGSDKALWSARASESSARDALFLAIGYTEDDFGTQNLAQPVLGNAEDLLTKAKSILEAKTAVRESFELVTARLKLEQAQNSASGWPSLLAGLAASGSYATTGTWAAGVNYSLSFSTLVSPQESTLAQAVSEAKRSLKTTELQARSDAKAALWNLQGAVSQLELSQKQVQPAQAALDAQLIRSSSGSGSVQKLHDLQINLLKAQESVVSAQADLEALLVGW